MSAQIKITCKGCSKVHDVTRTREIPEGVTSMWCNWGPCCDDNPDEEYNEGYNYEPIPEPEDPAQLKLFPEDSHKETIECPECKCIQQAEVKHTIPFRTYVHHCEKCAYVIMESEWNQVSWLKKQEMEFKQKFKQKFKQDAEKRNPFNVGSKDNSQEPQ